MEVASVFVNAQGGFGARRLDGTLNHGKMPPSFRTRLIDFGPSDFFWLCQEAKRQLIVHGTRQKLYSFELVGKDGELVATEE